MENLNTKEYINELINTFNKYDYFTNDNQIELSIKKLNAIKNHNQLLNCLEDLHSKNLVYQFLHKKSYLIKNFKISTEFDDIFKELINYLEKNPNELLTNSVNISIKNTPFNITKLIVIEKSLNKDLINESINLVENVFKKTSLNKTEYPIMFNEIKKIHEAPDYFGRFSKNESLIEISKIDNKFKLTSLTHEYFHALDYTILNKINDKYKNMEIESKEFTSFIFETREYDQELLDALNIPLEKIKNDEDFKSFLNFCDNFDQIPESKKLSQEDTKEYIKQYLNIDINDCKDETEFTQQVLEIYSNEKNKLSEKVLKIIPENTEKIKKLSKEMYNYYHTDYSNQSMYSLMSDMISKLSSEKDDYKCGLNEKCARVFEMNSYSNKNEDVYKLRFK